MAFTPRSWQVILASIIANITANPVLASLITNTSPVSHWRLWAFIQALLSNTNEQAAAVFVDEVEQRIALGHAATPPWIQAQIFLFQYNVNVGYLIQITDGITVGYANIVPADRIISNCAVVPNLTGQLKVKVTTGTPAAALSANQIIALNSYLKNFLSPNQQYSIVSTNGDQLRISGTVYFNGQINGAVQQQLITALNDYMATFSTTLTGGGSFNGLAKVSDIEKTILAIPGVVDWVPTQITITPIVGVPTNLIIGSAIIQRSYQAYSGYLIEDVTNPFSSTITFASAVN